MIVAPRKTLGPELEDIDRRRRLMVERSRKDRASLLDEMECKRREQEERLKEARAVLKKRALEKRAKDAVAIIRPELEPAAREMVERLEREREARIQQEIDRRNGHMTSGQLPSNRSSTLVMEHTPFEPNWRTHTKVHMRIARSIAKVNALLSLP